MGDLSTMIGQSMTAVSSTGAGSHLMPMLIASMVVFGLAAAVCIKMPSLLIGALFSRGGLVIVMVAAFFVYAGVLNTAMISTLMVNFVAMFTHILTSLWHQMAGV